MSWLDRLKQGMKKTAAVFSFKSIDFNSLEELEEALLRADVGYTTTDEIITALKKKKPQNMDELKSLMRSELVERLGKIAVPLAIDKSREPFVILMAGVNGAGKTTTIGKLGKYYADKGFKISQPEEHYFLVEASWFPKVLKGIDIEDYEALQYMQRVLEKSGIFDALREKGIEEGDVVSLYDIEFEYVP